MAVTAKPTAAARSAVHKASLPLTFTGAAPALPGDNDDPASTANRWPVLTITGLIRQNSVSRLPVPGEFDTIWAMLSSLLIGLAILSLPAYLGYGNWQRHRDRWLAARARGWRYAPTGWRAALRGAFSLAGTAAGSTVWDLVPDRPQRSIYWTSYGRQLPYGRLVVMPRYTADTQALFAKAGLRPMTAHLDRFGAHYLLLATHDQLRVDYFKTEAELALMSWPLGKARGALNYVAWSPEKLEINCRFDSDWVTIERLVTLGTTLVAGRAARPAD